MRVCPNCGEHNAGQMKFCGQCGTPLANCATRQEERKVVTVLFADLVGFTSRSEAMDVEDVRGAPALPQALAPRSLLPEQARRDDLPLVGRKKELASVVAALGRSIDEPSTQLVTLIGAPGIGKTRLVEELGVHVEELPGLVRWRRGRSLAYGEGVACWALGEMVKAEAGVLESDAA